MPDLDIADCFAVDGPLAGALPGYSPRASQIELAQAIGETIDSRGTLVAEAGTGIGKTWAYLVPAMLKGGKVLISTGTRTLQDQLFSRDLPRVRAALTIPVSTALLKGRSNYICHYHLERLEGDERALKSRSEISQLRAIQVFAKSTRTGDRGELGKIPEDAEIWQRVTSTRENCLGQECPHIRDCFVVKARKQAQEADIVVINHALFMADLVLRESGITDLLPDADTIIFDEAHQLPDTATRFLGSSVSTHQLLDFARMTEVAGLAHAREAMNWSEAHKRIETAARELRLAAAPVEKMPGRKATFENIPQPEAFDQALAALYDAVDNTSRSLAALGERHPDLATAARAGTDIAARLVRWSQPGRQGAAVRGGRHRLPFAAAQAPEARDAEPATSRHETGLAAAADGASSRGEGTAWPAQGAASAAVDTAQSTDEHTSAPAGTGSAAAGGLVRLAGATRPASAQQRRTQALALDEESHAQAARALLRPGAGSRPAATMAVSGAAAGASSAHAASGARAGVAATATAASAAAATSASHAHAASQDARDAQAELSALLGDVAPAATSGAGSLHDWTGPSVRWVEHGNHHIRLHSAPLSVARAFSRFRRANQAWILTSATLSVANDFRHFTHQLGLYDARSGQWASPFDYPTQGLLYVPQGMPEPQSPQFLPAFADRLMPLLQASPGGALVLCTTLRAVDRMAELLADRFDDAGIEWPLLKQGEATRRDLLERFQALDHPVLVGSASFWEGIDLPGRVLTLVAIDKLPFAPPDDPVIEARLRACRERGGNPFAEYQLPEAAISLKQGAGRLIRTESDWGVLMVADTRLVDKPYGKRLWRGLPPFARTRDPAQAVAFFDRHVAP